MISEKNKTVELKYSIMKNRVNYYLDFTLCLLENIFKYYIDKETLSEDVDIKNFYNYCFDRTCKIFLEENVDFTQNNELKEYFFTYYYHYFFKTDKDPDIKYFKNFWKSIFNVNNPKNKTHLNALVELYTIFDNSLSTKNFTKKSE